MSIKVGINGFGRIGKAIFRAAQNYKDIEIVAINDLLNINYIAYIMKFDSTHGYFDVPIDIKNNVFVIHGKKIAYFQEKNLSKLKWKSVGVDVVVESTGKFLTKEKLYQHIFSGAKRVILTSPPRDKNIPMFVMGVNHETYKSQKIISNASCTTNCLAPLAKIINNKFGISEGFVTSIHAITTSQNVIDSSSNTNWRIGRSALQNIIPSITGANQAIGKIIPELNGVLNGISFRVPVHNVSVIDLTIRLKKSVNYRNIFEEIQRASHEEFKNILGYVEDEVVSSDFCGNKLISIFDVKASSLLNPKFAKLISWYDNEIGYSNKILDLIMYIFKK